MKTKSSPTIKKATLIAFDSMPDYFRGSKIHKIVKKITQRRDIYIDSTLRKMRLLRSDGKINYVRIGSKEDSLYKKLS